MNAMIAREAELRRAVIDRMIDASVNAVQETREADLARWRRMVPDTASAASLSVAGAD